MHSFALILAFCLHNVFREPRTAHWKMSKCHKKNWAKIAKISRNFVWSWFHGNYSLIHKRHFADFSRGARMALFGHLIHPKAHLHNVQPSGRFVFDFPVLSVFSQSCLRQLASVSETDEPVTCNITTTDIWGWPNLSIKCKFGMSKRKKNNCSMVTCI